MASAFWTVEDGSTLARNWVAMAAALKVIHKELAHMKGAEEFATYIAAFVFQEGDKSNGYGGIWRRGESLMFNFDLRTFAPQNRAYFWQATQSAFAKLKTQREGQLEDVHVTAILKSLLSRRKKIRRGDNSLEWNDMWGLEPAPSEQLGPGW